MSDTSRRTFIAASGAGVAAGTIGITSGVAEAAVRRTARSAQEPVVVHVKDHTSSTLRLMVGEREVVVDDRALVVRILNAAGGE